MSHHYYHGDHNVDSHDYYNNNNNLHIIDEEAAAADPYSYAPQQQRQRQRQQRWTPTTTTTSVSSVWTQVDASLQSAQNQWRGWMALAAVTVWDAFTTTNTTTTHHNTMYYRPRRDYFRDEQDSIYLEDDDDEENSWASSQQQQQQPLVYDYCLVLEAGEPSTSLPVVIPTYLQTTTKQQQRQPPVTTTIAASSSSLGNNNNNNSDPLRGTSGADGAASTSSSRSTVTTATESSTTSSLLVVVDDDALQKQPFKQQQHAQQQYQQSPPPHKQQPLLDAATTLLENRLSRAGLRTERVHGIVGGVLVVVLKIACPPQQHHHHAATAGCSWRQQLQKLQQLPSTPMTLEKNAYSSFQQQHQQPPTPVVTTMMIMSMLSPATRYRRLDALVRSLIRGGDTSCDNNNKKVSDNDDATAAAAANLSHVVQARVPLHDPERVDDLVQRWVYYWNPKNWQTTQSSEQQPESTLLQLHHDDDDDDGYYSFRKTPSSPPPRPTPPPFLMRVVMGAFYQPLTTIQEYYGAQVTYYFCWLQHCAIHLLSLTIVGLIVFAWQIVGGRWDTQAHPLFSVIVMLWTFSTLIQWQTRAEEWNQEWRQHNNRQHHDNNNNKLHNNNNNNNDDDDDDETNTPRPQFHGDVVKDDVTGESVLRYPMWKRWLTYSVSFPLTILFTCVTLVVILWVHSNRDIKLTRYLDENLGGPPPSADVVTTSMKFEVALTAIGRQAPNTDLRLTPTILRDPKFWFILFGMPGLLGLLLPLLNFVLMKLAVCLNDFENYRTEAEYRTFLVAKVFGFRFVSYFAASYYYAFVSMGSGRRDLENGILCLRIASGVLVYTTLAQWWHNLMHVLLPMGLKARRMRQYSARLNKELKAIEEEEKDLGRMKDAGMTEQLKQRRLAVLNRRILLHQAHDGVWEELNRRPHDSFPEYIHAVVQFTFVSCFTVMLPITPLICMINHLVAMRLGAYKLCRGRRRPLPERAEGIGIWEHLLHIVAIVSVLTNCWFLVYTNTRFSAIGQRMGREPLFFLLVGIMLLIKYIMQLCLAPSFRRAVLRRKAADSRSVDHDKPGNESLEQTGPSKPRRKRSSSNSQTQTLDIVLAATMLLVVLIGMWFWPAMSSNQTDAAAGMGVVPSENIFTPRASTNVNP